MPPRHHGTYGDAPSKQTDENRLAVDRLVNYSAGVKNTVSTPKRAKVIRASPQHTLELSGFLDDLIACMSPAEFYHPLTRAKSRGRGLTRLVNRSVNRSSRLVSRRTVSSSRRKR
jgi:hypothetical protein